MGIAPYHRSYKRVRPGGGGQAAGYVPNPACHLTDQGADPDPADLGWCIRRRWRVIYYTARQAAGRPLWDGVDDFEILMADVLLRLSPKVTSELRVRHLRLGGWQDVRRLQRQLRIESVVVPEADDRIDPGDDFFGAGHQARLGCILLRHVEEDAGLFQRLW